MRPYLAAHDEFVAWLEKIAAARGMSSTHWAFVVDGLVAYVNRRRPGDILLSSYIARGFDMAAQWNALNGAQE